MKSAIIKLLILGATSLFFACSSPIKHVIVSPEISIVNSNLYQNKQAQLSFSGLRRSNHIVQILRSNQAAELYSPQQSLVSTVESSLTSALKANGLNVQSLATNQIEVIIDSAMVSVHQELLKYTANNEMNVRVVVNNSQGTLTKAFRITGKSNGPFKADLAVLERDFNQQLATLLTQIVQNDELQSFIQ